jgi:two-component system nitrogen regulation response regulator GlnG
LYWRKRCCAKTCLQLQTCVVAALDVATEETARKSWSVTSVCGGSGLELLEKVKAKNCRACRHHHDGVSDLTAPCRRFRSAPSTTRQAFDLTKAVELIRRAVEESQRELKKNGCGSRNARPSPAMRDVFRAIGRLSRAW